MKKLIFICSIFFICIESSGANLVKFSSIKELPSGEISINFRLDKVALIKSYALDEPSRLVIDIKDSELFEESDARQNYPIKKIRTNQDGASSKIVLDLYESGKSAEW